MTPHRRSRRSIAVLFAVVMLLGTMTAAVAQTDDPIPDPIPGSDVDVALETVADGFTTPLWGTHAPNDSRRLFVVDQVGKVWAVALNDDPSLPGKHLFLDIGVDGQDLLVPLGAFGPGSFDERGLLGLAFHPDYWDNGLLYTFSSEPTGSVAPVDFTTMPADTDAFSLSVIREWTVPNPRMATATVDPSSTRVLMTIDKPQFNHNGGAIAFGPDGHLYIGVGDGGAADDQGVGHVEGGNGQSLAPGNVLGKILRIDIDGDDAANGQYGIPADNPMIGTDGADEIFAYGFRNPYRISFDSRTGRLYAADVGQNDIEEVDIVHSGGNYGWPVKEGTFLFDMNGDGPGFVTDDSPGSPAGMIDPIVQYDHDEGVSITGGFVYNGKAAGDLRGDYVFAEWAGRLFHIDDSGEIAELTAPGLRVTGFGQDAHGEVYILGTENVPPVGTTGTVQKIVANG